MAIIRALSTLVRRGGNTPCAVAQKYTTVNKFTTLSGSFRPIAGLRTTNFESSLTSTQKRAANQLLPIIKLRYNSSALSSKDEEVPLRSIPLESLSLPGNVILAPEPVLKSRGTAVYTPVDVTKPQSFVRPVVRMFEGERSNIEDTVTLDMKVFGVPMRPDICNDVVLWQRARMRQGTHSAKTRAEVRGGGRKPFSQKGTGRARQGSIRAPHMRKGGVAHPPKPRSHAFKLNKKVRLLALKVALSAKLKEGKLIIIDHATMSEIKTKNVQKIYDQYGWRNALLIDGRLNPNTELSARAIPKLHILPHLKANVYDILKNDCLILTVDAVDLLQRRLLGEKMDTETVSVYELQEAQE